MHELAQCSVRAGAHGADVAGFVRAFDGVTLTMGTDQMLSGFGLGQDVTVRVLDEVRGEYLYAGFVADRNEDTLVVADVDLVTTLQKREVTRVRVSVPCSGFLTRSGPVRDADAEGDEDPAAVGPGAPDDAPTGPPVAAGAAVHFTVLDIGAHGMRMLTRAHLPTGSVLRFVFPEVTPPFELMAVVLRSEYSRSGYHYGCRFDGTTTREADRLFRYVLRTQGEQRRERLRT